ncbi:MAG: bifunctional precorrin-2 dehydrogenase/sirohydrochlorin ferrochelatase [Deltaproteobacteria bacterium]|nr:bifunctional precorrin-2 dehydrogenase/sirohydrochlorin ferrochelatase [Deltaproteobacteria bacterium]
MRYYPVSIVLAGRKCVVVGAGAVAARKAGALIGAGALVTVIGPASGAGIAALVKSGAVRLVKRRYKRGDLAGAFLVVSASDSSAVNRAVFEEASSLGILINCVDAPELCNFIVPAVVDRGDLVIAVSTSARFPALAARLRRELEAVYGPEYGLFVDIIGAVRRKLLKSRMKRDKKERVINELAGSRMPQWLAERDLAGVDGFLMSLLGPGYTLRGLGMKAMSRDREP